MEMADRMSKELRSEMHNAEVQLNNWVAEREQRLADIQVSQASPCSSEGSLGAFLVAVGVLLLWKDHFGQPKSAKCHGAYQRRKSAPAI